MILAGCTFGVVWQCTRRSNGALVLSQTAFVIFAGIFFVMADRATEITLQGVGSIKAAAHQATRDAEEIRALRNRVEAQSTAIGTVAGQAGRAKELIDRIVVEKATADAARLGTHEARMEGDFAVPRSGIADLRQMYRSRTGTQQIAIIQYVWSRRDIPKRDRVQFMVDILKADSDRIAVEYAARCLEEEARLHVEPGAVGDYLKWWETAKDTIQ